MLVDKNSPPRFTVIIPTKDRGDYLHHTLKTCSSQEYSNLEIIVSDDGSKDNTREVVLAAAEKDSRIKYITPGSVGMRDNFEFALNHMSPGYVIALGGDDALLPYAIENMHNMLVDSGKEILTWRVLMFAYPAVRSGKGQLGLYRPGKSRIVKSKEYLERQVKTLNYLGDIETPMFYIKGVVSTELIERVRRRNEDGRFYSCPTPDGFSGIVLGGEVHDYAFCGTPLTISGASPTSQGMAYLSQEEEGKKLSEHFYQTVATVPMHAELASQPYSPLITLMTADYLLTARDLPGWPGVFSEINYQSLLLKSLAELSDGLYAKNRMSRELAILNQIAEYHGLGDFFRSKVKGRRKFIERAPYVGNGITLDQILLDCDMFKIHNINEASYFAYYAYQIFSNFKISLLNDTIVNSLLYKLHQSKKGILFPDESEWINEKLTE